ncbi:ATP-binding protein [Candidatus Woesearchaeota archaeon]|nr:MAG: ATP-binding protein [Candidatus Woesearchaeota archaeon]
MKEVFKKIISEWLEKKLPDLVERDIPTKLTNDILSIIGPRRAGKTFFMFQIIKGLLRKTNKEEILFIDFEDNRLVGLKPKDLDDIFIAHKELSNKSPKYLFFDEIQEVKLWSKFIRRLHNTQKFKIIISGSSSKLLSKEIATELRGRYSSRFITTFSFKEFLKFKKFKFTRTTEYTEKKGVLLRLFKEYLETGGYPEIIKLNDFFERKEKINNYYDTIFYRDIIERHKITNYDALDALMNYLLNDYATIFSITQFEKFLKEKGTHISKKTISAYLKYLSEAFFIYAIEEFSYSAKKRLMRPKKIYVIDNGMISCLSTQFSPDKGRMLENLVLTELKRKQKSVYYYKEKQECDFLIKEGIKITQAIQVSFELNEKNKRRELKGLLEAMKQFNLKKGLILTNNQEKELVIENKKIMIKPVWKWLLEQ